MSPVYRHKCHSAIAALRGKTLSSSAARRGVVDRWEDTDTAVPANWNDSYQALTERASLITSQMEEEDIEMFYSLNALYGRFLANAIEGIKYQLGAVSMIIICRHSNNHRGVFTSNEVA